jgi:hypothetical protein
VSSAGVVPEVLAFILCDDVITDRETGKRSIIGTFSTIHVRRTPALHPRMAIYIALTEGRGEQLLRIVVSHVESEKSVVQVQGKLTINDPMAVGELGVRIVPLPLPEPGTYAVDLYANNEPIKTRRFRVELLKPPAAPPPEPAG